MKITNRFNLTPRLAICVHHEGEPVVQNGLAITPKRMYELTMKGIPISEQTAQYQNQYHDGCKNPPNQVEVIFQRNVDINDVWNAQKDAQQMIKNLDQSVFDSPDVTPIISAL